MSDEEVVDGIAWTPALRELVIPSRRIANGAADPLDVDATRRLASYASASKEASVERSAAAWRPAVAEAIARAGKPIPDGEPDLEVEVATTMLDLRPVYAAIPYWLTMGGVGFALRVLIRCHEVECRRDGKLRFLVESRDLSTSTADAHHNAWRLLRIALASSVEPLYDEAHGIADAARLAESKRPLGQAGLLPLLAFAFPDELAWAEQAAPHARALLTAAHKRTKKMWGNRTFSPALARFIAVAPVDTAVAMLTEAINTGLEESDLITALAHHGAAGGAAIYHAALAHTAVNDATRKLWSSHLVAIRTPDARRVLTRLTRLKSGARVFKAALERHKKLS
jgi:hypothetical protein